ncbi:MAG: (2Fe-2S)-binding protein [Armatimonadetes bacterium]|nr:(2Fe-2S)-binding protein [Armatimonadota bacterium]
MDGSEPGDGQGFSRRDFLRGAATGAVVSSLVGQASAADPPAPSASAPIVSGAVTAQLMVNGHRLQVVVEPRTTLLDALRDGKAPDGKPIDLTGAKRVCDRGACGSCTVLFDGKPVYACSVLALDALGHAITTVEGLGDVDRLHPVQEAFVQHDALMCGFCTPGFVVAAAGLLKANPHPSPEEIRRGLGGNLCRCGTYSRILEAVAEAARTGKGA